MRLIPHTLTLVTTLLLAGLLLQSTAAAGLIVFSDETFDDTDWSSTRLVGPLGGQTDMQVPDGGNSGTNPDPFFSVRTNTDDPVQYIHVNFDNVYDPSFGAITSIDFSIDFQNISFFGQGQAFHLAVVQSNVPYLSAQQITGPGGNNWTNFESLELTADDFTLNDFSPGIPNFSSTGAPLRFGFATANSGGDTIEVGYDNWTVEVTAVPEPSSLAIGGACVVFCILRRRRITKR